MRKKIKIMLIEDNKLIRVGIKTLLIESGLFDIVFEASNGKEAAEASEIISPDVILLDIGLPDISGIKLINELYKKYNSAKIIILSSHNTCDEVDKSISLGIYAYIIKDICSDMLINAIKTVYKGGMWFDPKVVPSIRQRKDSIFSAKIPRKTFKSTHSNLTQREFEVLRLIVEGKSNNDIAKELCISEHTAKAHVCNIIQKLVVDDRTQAAVKAVKDGIIQ